ncbi:hypothetical protein AYM40_36150 (plasmid) [Paraburkholderia phytofirmans OLGA172]|uniref:Uncharacterized protein n=1 Tax=Paraburkholderia phytofirmans OLGA172 TaxID=1417228 RepID=A0A160FX75_9BURK|nr:hypothetical protein AYM40_36150 [Paraburkholderia phytofirmans OLGA172]
MIFRARGKKFLIMRVYKADRKAPRLIAGMFIAKPGGRLISDISIAVIGTRWVVHVTISALQIKTCWIRVGKPLKTKQRKETFPIRLMRDR